MNIKQYGFSWGQVEVERLIEHKGHRLLRIRTKKQQLEIRVTPTGLIRIENAYKVTPTGLIRIENVYKVF